MQSFFSMTTGVIVFIIYYSKWHGASLIRYKSSFWWTLLLFFRGIFRGFKHVHCINMLPYASSGIWTRGLRVSRYLNLTHSLSHSATKEGLTYLLNCNIFHRAIKEILWQELPLLPLVWLFQWLIGFCKYLGPFIIYVTRSGKNGVKGTT